MTDDNIVSIVQVPDTFFENNNRDETTLFDDLAKMMFHLLKKHQRMLHKIVLFIPHPAFPITSQSLIQAMSPVIHSDMVCLICVHVLMSLQLLIGLCDTSISFEVEIEYEQMK